MAQLAAAETPIAGLQAAYRNGQVFLTWKETETPPGTFFNVYLAKEPITTANLAQARRIGHHVERHSARDWWQDPASFDPNAAPGAPIGFQIENGAAPLDPQGGLFVHTVLPGDAGKCYFAVTATNPQGEEEKTLTPGANALAQPVACKVASPQPIWLGKGDAPAQGAGKGKSLLVNLHARGGGITAGPNPQAVNALFFGDARQGWREGLPFKFYVSVTADRVDLRPCDRAWTGRPVMESPDARDHCPAVNTFWYGYNSRIYENTHTTKTVAPNYTEEQVLGLVRWAQEYLGADPNRVYLTGGSMGGSGSVSFCLHYPHLFAAAMCMVPAVSYTRRGSNKTLGRLECTCGPLDETATTADGSPLLARMDGERAVTESKADLPYLFMVHGRTDKSIPWENNPPFYRTMEAARQGFSTFWSNGDHATAGTLAPADVKAWSRRLERYRLDQSFPVFTHCSADRNPGNGDPADGDLEGWINRGLDWKDLVDTPSEYSITVFADYPGIQFPLTVDVTPRRVQRFRLQPGETVQAQIGDAAPVALHADAHGLVTAPAVPIRDAGGTRVRLTR